MLNVSPATLWSSAEYVFSQSAAEERANAASHGMAMVLAVAALPATAVGVEGMQHPARQAGVGVFFATMVMMYMVSTLYHLLPVGPTKKVLRRWDHALIFLFIAGSFTPFSMLAQQHGHAAEPLYGVWIAALLGMWLKLSGRLRRPWSSTVLYMAFAWTAAWIGRDVLALLSREGAVLVVTGGVCYTLGCVFFMLDRRLRYSHLIWHLFVVAGSLCHVMAVQHTRF